MIRAVLVCLVHWCHVLSRVCVVLCSVCVVLCFVLSGYQLTSTWCPMVTAHFVLANRLTVCNLQVL